MLSSVISSCVLISRAIDISSWPSTTLMPSRCSANMTGGSTTSTPTGSPSRPRCSSSIRIFFATSASRPISGVIAPAHRRNARPRALAEPWAVELVVASRRAEVPQDRLVILRQQRKAADLVLRPRADVRGRDVADVVHVEAQQRSELRLREQPLDAVEPLAPQPIEIDPLLPIHRHRAVGLQCHRCPRRSGRKPI